METSRDTVKKIVIFGVIWLSALFIGHFAFAGIVFYDTMTRFIIGGMLFVGAAIITDAFLRLYMAPSRESQKSNRREATGGAENLRLRDMMGLLDDDDLDDLRGELRESLRERIRNLSAAEVDSFDDLLADASAKRKRR